jgi:hypothetical protein
MCQSGAPIVSETSQWSSPLSTADCCGVSPHREVGPRSRGRQDHYCSGSAKPRGTKRKTCRSPVQVPSAPQT